MKILLADKFPELQLSSLRSRSHECTVDPDLDTAALAGAIGGYEALVVRSTRVTEEVLRAADALRLIVRAGAGTNTIDVGAARAREIDVCNVPGRNAVAVAELAMGLLIASDRLIPDAVAELRAGRWNKKAYSRARGLMGRTMGIIGVGAVGLAVAERARAFGMRVLAVDRPGRASSLARRLEELGVATVGTRRMLIEASDVITLHVPAISDTTGMVDAQFLAAMRPGALLINTSRGDVVDEAALIDAMDRRGIRAALDVFADEPSAAEGVFDSALARHPNVYGTHHIGASTEQAQSAVADGVVDIFAAYVLGERLNCVNAA